MQLDILNSHVLYVQFYDKDSTYDCEYLKPFYGVEMDYDNPATYYVQVYCNGGK